MLRWKIKYSPSKNKPTEIYIYVKQNEGNYEDTIMIDRLHVDMSSLSIVIQDEPELNQVLELIKLLWKLKTEQDILGWGTRY